MSLTGVVATSLDIGVLAAVVDSQGRLPATHSLDGLHQTSDEEVCQ